MTLYNTCPLRHATGFYIDPISCPPPIGSPCTYGSLLALYHSCILRVPYLTQYYFCPLPVSHKGSILGCVLFQSTYGVSVQSLGVDRVG